MSCEFRFFWGSKITVAPSASPQATLDPRYEETSAKAQEPLVVLRNARGVFRWGVTGQPSMDVAVLYLILAAKQLKNQLKLVEIFG